MSKRKITNLFNVDFKPFDNYGVTVPGMSWHKISYDKQNGGYGTYILKMEPNAKSCLLYTSPSPRDATLSRMPSSA